MRGTSGAPGSGRVCGRMAAAVVAAAAGSACGQVCQPWWRVTFAPKDALYGFASAPLNEGRVTSTIVFDDDGAGPRAPGLYAAGPFTYMGNVRATGIGRWDGTEWSRLGAMAGAGLVGASGTYSMATWGPTAGPDELYVIADAVGANLLGVSRWNGTQWRAAATNSLHYWYLGYQYGFPAELWSLDPDGPGPAVRALYAGQTEIAAYQTDGGTWGTLWKLSGPGGVWEAVQFGTPGPTPARVDSLVVFDDDGPGPGASTLFMTRYRSWYYSTSPKPPFPSTGGSEASIAKVTATGLTHLVTTDSGVFSSLAVFDADGPGPQNAALYVGGDFPVGTLEHVRLARLDGSVLTPIGNDDGTVSIELDVVDEDGAGPGLPVLYARGNFSHIGGIAASGIARFNGTNWSAMGPGVSVSPQYDQVRSVTAFDDDGAGPKPPFVYAGGNFRHIGYAQARGIARWNGNNWQPPGPMPNNAVRTLVAADVGQGMSLYAGGSFTTVDGLLAVGVARWDGAAWSRLTGGMNNRVDAMAVYGGKLVAAGKFTWAGGGTANRVARWTGSAWQALGTGVDGDATALAVDGVNLYAAGVFASAGGGPALRVAKWNGAQWSALGAGLDGTVNALAMHGGSLYAGGEFVMSGATAVNHIARWNGTAWTGVGGGITEPVSHLVSHRGKLYAGSTCGTAACISAWDGAAWSSVPAMSNEGEPATLTGLGSVDEDGAGPSDAFLYASGEFVSAGTAAAQRLARWDGVEWTAGSLGAAALDKPARAFAGFGDPPVVYVGGDFTRVGSAGGIESWYLAGYDDCPTPCYANCDGSTATPVLNVNDYVCFQQRFSAGYPDANCDGSTAIPVLNVNDYVCFMGRYAAGCP